METFFWALKSELVDQFDSQVKREPFEFIVVPQIVP
jgi:hypothetical protein